MRRDALQTFDELCMDRRYSVMRAAFVRMKTLGYLLSKRIFDIFLSAVGLAVLAVPMACLAVYIRRDSPGPAIYRQERLGLRGKPFVILKFRTMDMDAEKNGAVWAAEDDTRCTKAGKWLRQTRIDELPQLWNILRGDMSFVGPRPEREYFYREFEKTISNFRSRLVVKPGLTGYAQVYGGLNLLPEEKLRYDLEYIRRRSIWLDLRCILKTFSVL